MRKAIVIASILVAISFCPVGKAEFGFINGIRFSPPAQMGPKISVANQTWIAISFSETDASAANLIMPGEGNWSEYVEHGYHFQDSLTNSDRYDDAAIPPNTTAFSGLTEQLAFGKRGPGSLYIEADRIAATLDSTRGTLTTYPGHCLNLVVPEALNMERNARYDLLCPQSPAMLRSEGMGAAEPHSRFIIHAEGVKLVEWHNAAATCMPQTSPCPGGGSRQQQTKSLGFASLDLRDLDFERVWGNGTIDVSGSSQIVLGGGSIMDVGIQGELRLPLATTSGSCIDCEQPANQSFLASGLIELRHLETNPDGTMSADIKGDFEDARFDEQAVAPSLFSGKTLATVAAASMGILAVLKFLIAPFFTRLTKEQALEHPRRKAIFEYIQQHPGANFREIARNTSIAAGTVRHHLNVLERSGQVVEHNHGSTVRLFENHGKFADNWSEVVLLREPSLGVLHEWLRSNPGSPQKAVLEAMEVHGWSRSTTQHRLSRLVEGGLASIRLQGRLKIYTLVEKPQRQGLLAGLKGPVPPAPTP